LKFEARLAFAATIHCLTGCAVGEVLGMVLGTAFDWTNAATVAASIVLAFLFGYAFTLRSLRAARLPLGRALRLALASDTLSIAVMEIVDNLFMLVVPGAMDARLDQPLFWGSLLGSLALAAAIALPVNGWLIARGQGHALVHQEHHHHG
jgi:hypothetical protein